MDAHQPIASVRRDALLKASTVHLPDGAWRTVLDCLCSRFPAVPRDEWVRRMACGRVLAADGQALAADHPYRAGLAVRYFREVPDEAPIAGVEGLLHVDDHLVVADKPHFLPVVPAGRFLRETLLARLQARLGNPDLVPLHRLDRGTAGLVLFSACRATRARYQMLFRDQAVAKQYEALAPGLPDLPLPAVRASRLVAGVPFFRMCEVAGPPNARTGIEVLARDVASLWRYRLTPFTGRKHQLRVHLAALGAPIANDPYYPTLRDEAADDPAAPLKLLARRLAFTDPLTGAPREFSSRLTL